MENGYARRRDLERLTELCRELAKFGVQVGLSDARPALSVRRDPTGPRTWIEIDASGASFVWRGDGLARHPVDDPAGAAVRLAGYVKNGDAERGHRP